MRTIYRTDCVRPILCLLLGGPFALACGFNIVALGPKRELVFIGLLGAIIVGVGVCILVTRVAIDDSSLEKRAPFAGPFRASWDEIESWWVDPGSTEDETLPQVYFRIRGRRRCEVIHAADVWRPSFHAFLQQVRAHIADRETANPGAGAAESMISEHGNRS